MPEYSCGCVNEIDNASGVLHCVRKCEFHLKWSADHPQGGSPEYFKEIGLLEDGISNNARLIEELLDPFAEMGIGEMFFYGNHRSLLELGCGLGCYIPLFLKLGWLYEAVEQSPYAARWTRNTFNVPVHEEKFEDFTRLVYYWNAIFGAHFFEHLRDSPAGLMKAYNYLVDDGVLYLIVPDDGDPTNPDHYWFYTTETLKGLLDQIGFKNIKIAVRKRVPQENFIYCVASKKGNL